MLPSQNLVGIKAIMHEKLPVNSVQPITIAVILCIMMDIIIIIVQAVWITDLELSDEM